MEGGLVQAYGWIISVMDAYGDMREMLEKCVRWGERAGSMEDGDG